MGRPITATDVDDDALAYFLSGSSAFVIDEDSGQIRVAENAVLDPETRDTYTVTVSAQDPSFASATIDVAITVTAALRAGGGGGGGGGFGAGPGEVLLVVTTAVVGENVPAGPDASASPTTCANARGYEPGGHLHVQRRRRAGHRTGRSWPPEIHLLAHRSPTTAAPSAVDGLFTDVVMLAGESATRRP